MKDEDAKFLLSVAALVLRHGVPATINIIKYFGNENPTVEDIVALKDRVPPPETYFETGG